MLVYLSNKICYECATGGKSGAAACKFRAHLVPAICIYIRPRFGRWGEENKGAKPRSFLSGPRSNRRGSFVALTAELMGRRFLEQVVLKLAPLLVFPFSNWNSFISTFSAVPRFVLGINYFHSGASITRQPLCRSLFL